MKNTPTTQSSFLSRKGFTLIEIMIVITIIGILMAFLAPRLFGVSDGARDLQRKGDLTTLQTAIMKYQQDNGAYPASPT
jgi:general secretion pathway protein G